MAAGDPSQAILQLHRALTLSPGHSRLTPCFAPWKTQAVEDALVLTRQRIAANPDDAPAYTRLSILLRRIGDIPAAEAAAARAKILGWKLQLEAAGN